MDCVKREGGITEILAAIRKKFITRAFQVGFADFCKYRNIFCTFSRHQFSEMNFFLQLPDNGARIEEENIEDSTVLEKRSIAPENWRGK